MVAQAAAEAESSPVESKRGRRRRILFVATPLIVCGWLVLSHFVVRAEIEEYASRTFSGKARVKWALLWPTLDVTAFGLTVEAEHHTLEASRVGVDVDTMGLFGGSIVNKVTVHGMVGEFDEGQPVHIFASSEESGGGKEASMVEGDDEVAFDLEPMRLPALDFRDPRIVLRSPERDWTVFSTTHLGVRQAGARTFDLETDAGVLAEVPFERLTGRLIPRAGHLLLSQLKLRAFNGMVGGLLDIDTADTGAFNGEIECHFVEVEKVWTTYRLPYAEKRRGDLSGKIVFKGARPTLAALRGKGELELTHASFFSPLSFKVFLFLKVPVAAEAPLTRGEMTFSFERSLLYLERAHFFARAFELESQGILSYDGQIDVEVEHAGTTVAVSGAVEDPRIKVLPLNGVTVPFDRMFRERVR